MESRTLMTGTITPLLNSPPNGSGTMLLETNGDILMVGGGDNTSNEWYQLAPDAKGNYVDGKWTQVASSNTPRLFLGSTVLQNGDIMELGGEYSGANNTANDNNTGEIYTPSTNTWRATAPFPKAQFGDDTLVTLANGKVLASYLAGPENYIYDPATDTWTQTGSKLNNDQNDEETFVKLADGSILSYAIFASVGSGKGQAQRYIPSSGTWVDAGSVPVALSENTQYEIGGGMLLPDGRVLQIGGTGHTAYYTPSTNSWVAGPDIPNGLVQDDAPAAILPNGKVILQADKIGYVGPASFFELDTTKNTYTDISSEFPNNFLDVPAFLGRYLELPNGQTLINEGSNNLVLYTPDSAALASNIPTIKSIVKNGTASFLLTGTGINGQSEGASFGDDAQMSTDYPIVSFTDSSGNVSYGTTTGWNGAIAQGATLQTTNVALPPNLLTGTYSVRVLANGAASLPFNLSLAGPSIASPATATPNPVFGTTTQLAVLGSDAAGEANLTYTWTTTSAPAGATTPTFAVNGTNAAKNDKATFYAVGAYTFTATVTNANGLSAISTVTVNVTPTLSSFSLTPTKVEVSATQSEQFIASGLDQFGNLVSSSAAFTWAVASGGGTVTQSGLYTAPATGTIATVTVKVSSSPLVLSSKVYVLSNPWVATDIGTPTMGGNAADNGTGQFTLLGAGTGISANSDQLQYTYLTVTGNGTIEAQVATIQNTNAAAEAGVMFRSDTSAGSADVMIGITPGNGLVFSYRSQTNGTTIQLTTPRVIAGDYVKLVRVGNLFTGSYSTNGTTWTSVGTVNVALSPTADVGLTTTSSNSSTLNTSTFSHVIADGNPTVVTVASANPNPVTTASTTLSVLGADPAGEPALTYTWTTTAFPAGAIAPSFATNGTNASKTDKVTFFKAGNYTFLVTLANALGYSTTSSVVVSVVSTQSSVQLTPLAATVPEGGTQLFIAAVYDQFGVKLAKQPQFTFSMLAGGVGGRVSSTGVYTAPTSKTGIDYVNVTGAGTAAVAKVTVVAGTSSNPSASKSGTGSVATIGSVNVGWGSDSATLVTASDGLRLLPAGRQVDLPWAGIQSLTVSLSQAAPLSASDVKVTGITVANYGPVTVTPVAGSSTSYLITFAQPINAADRVTVTVANAGVATYTRRLDVLPGDVNDDGVVNSTDASIASGYLLSSYVFADITGSGVVSSKSVKSIQLLNGTTLPMVG